MNVDWIGLAIGVSAGTVIVLAWYVVIPSLVRRADVVIDAAIEGAFDDLELDEPIPYALADPSGTPIYDRAVAEYELARLATEDGWASTLADIDGLPEEAPHATARRLNKRARWQG